MNIIRSTALIMAGAACILISAAPQRHRPDGPAIEEDEAADLDRRITAIEGINLEHRLTKLETDLDDIDIRGRGTMGGVGILLFEAVIRLAKKRREDGPA